LTGSHESKCITVTYKYTQLVKDTIFVYIINKERYACIN